jgi:hypothetical protein
MVRAPEAYCILLSIVCTVFKENYDQMTNIACALYLEGTQEIIFPSKIIVKLRCALYSYVHYVDKIQYNITLLRL